MDSAWLHCAVQSLNYLEWVMNIHNFKFKPIEIELLVGSHQRQGGRFRDQYLLSVLNVANFHAMLLRQYINWQKRQVAGKHFLFAMVGAIETFQVVDVDLCRTCHETNCSKGWWSFCCGITYFCNGIYVKCNLAP